MTSSATFLKGLNPRALLIAGSAAVAVALPANADVRVERVVFASEGEVVSADLYIPDGVGGRSPAPAVVVVGAWMTVKEQMPARYARELADRGLIALVFDFRGWGESAGARRQFEDPGAKIQDIRAAATYLSTRAEVDGRIGGLGICAGSGYMVAAASTTTSIRSVALIAPWLHDALIVDQVYGGAQGVSRLLELADAAEVAYRASGQQTFVPAASLTDERAIMFGAPYYTEADRGLIPQWRNEADPAFWRGWLEFDAIGFAPRLRQPFLMVHSEAAAIPQGARRFFAAVSAPKAEIWLEDVSQFDFYDRPGPVGEAADAAAAHFRRTLTGGRL